MTMVTVRGGHVAVDDLPTGAVATCEFTPKTRRRIVGGYYELVSPETLEEADARQAEEDERIGGVPADPNAPEVEKLPVPRGNASGEEWEAFLRSRGIAIPLDDDGEVPGRDTLRAIWDKAKPEE